MTCLEARAPPPLPPRAILSKQSSLLTSPTVLPQRSLPVAVSLPPLPARGGDTLCLKTPSSEEVAPEYFFPPGRCLPQQQQQPPPPIGSPTASARKKTGDSMTRRPLPPEPANPSVGADQSRQVYTQVTRKTETATRRSPGASRKAPGGGESVATRGEPKPSPPPPPPVRLLPGETTAAAREFSETASSAVPPKSPAGKTAAAAAPSKLRSCESFGACEFRQAQRNPDARGGAQVRRIQTTPRLNLEEGEAKKSRIQLQAQLVDDCLRRSLTKGETTACDDAGKVRIRPALPVLIAAKAQEGPTTTCTLLMKYEDPLSPGTPAQTGHELRPAYAPATSSSGEGLQKPDVNADRARDPGGVRAEQGPAKGPEKVMASSSDCNRGLRAQLMSELRSNQLGPECVGSSQEPANKEQRQNPPTSDNVVEKTRAKMEDFDTTPAATAAAAAAAARCFEELWWSEELGAKPDTPEMFRSEAATRSFKKDRKKDEGNSILRIEQQLKSLFSEDCSDSFSTPPTARDSGKPLTVPQTGDAKPEVAAAMATCDRKQSYDVTYCKDPCRRIPIPRLPTCPRLPSFEENTDAVRAARSGQSAQSSCQLTTEQFASGISQERRDIGSDHKSERKSSKCTTRSPQMSSRRPSREADD